VKQDDVLSRRAVASEVASQVFGQLCQAGIPIDLSVQFLVRVCGWQVVDFCAELGIHRSYFSALLKGQHVVSLTIRFGVRQRLGFDPWRESAETVGREGLDLSFHSGEHDRPQPQGAAR